MNRKYCHKGKYRTLNIFTSKIGGPGPGGTPPKSVPFLPVWVLVAYGDPRKGKHWSIVHLYGNGGIIPQVVPGSSRYLIYE